MQAKVLTSEIYPYSDELWEKLVREMMDRGNTKSFDARTGQTLDIDEVLERCRGTGSGL
jgi:hypothetical protein